MSENNDTCSIWDNCKTKCACIVEADESSRKCVEGTILNGHKDHTAGKGINSVSHYNLARKFIPLSQAMKIPDAKAKEDKEWEKQKRNTRMTAEANQKQNRGDR